MGLLGIIEKKICNILGNRKANINTGNEFSNHIYLLSRVPQGSVLSPTLHTLYTNNLPSPEYNCLDIMYADDITQIITSPSRSRLMMKIRVETFIERLDKLERKRKMQSSKEKKNYSNCSTEIKENKC